jgi:hypothetical protein
VNLPVQEIFTCRDSRTRPPSYSRISQIPEVRGSAGSWLCVFTNSRLRGFASSRFQAIACSRLRGFESSGFQTTALSRLRDFVSSRFQIFASSLLLKTCITNFINLDVSRVTSFPEFPSLAPRGSGLTPTIRFDEHFRILVKNVTLGTSEGTRVIRKPRNGRIEVRSQNYPPCPYK